MNSYVGKGKINSYFVSFRSSIPEGVRFREGVETWGCLSWVEASATSLPPLWEAPGEEEALGTCCGMIRGWGG